MRSRFYLPTHPPNLSTGPFWNKTLDVRCLLNKTRVVGVERSRSTGVSVLVQIFLLVLFVVCLVGRTQCGHLHAYSLLITPAQSSSSKKGGPGTNTKSYPR